MIPGPVTNRWHQAYCRVAGLDPAEWPEDRCLRLSRYSFLSAFSLRDDAEEAEVWQLHAEFSPIIEWPVVPREFHKSVRAPRPRPSRSP
jgi:hypothetical protein